MAAEKPQVEVYRDTAGEYRWRLRAVNGNILADSGEGYETSTSALEAVDRVRLAFPDATLQQE